MTAIGFIGLGNMGGPMAANLLKAGHDVTGFDLSAEALARLVAGGGKRALSADAAAAAGDVVITMLPAGPHVRTVYLGAGGVLASARQGSVLIDCSTIDVESARAVGTESDFARAEPILQAMGKTIVHAGMAGNGQAAKICNNMMLGISMIAVCEGFALAEKLGLDWQRLFDISSKSSGQCWAMTNYCPVPGPVPTSPANRGYKAGFTAEMMLKDLKLAQQAAQGAGAATPLGANAASLFALMVNAGDGAADFSAIFRFLTARTD